MKLKICVVPLAAVLLGIAPTLFAKSPASRQLGESAVMAGREAVKLAFRPIPGQRIEVRSTYRLGLKTTIRYRVGRDYVVTQDGGLRRTAKSRIPDYRKNEVFGLDTFNHFEHANYSNKKFFVYVDYSYISPSLVASPPKELGAEALDGVHTKLAKGDRVKVIAFGDSVTAGGESTSTDLIYWERWLNELQSKYPQADIQGVNSGQGGDLTEDGLARMDASVISHKPDLVLIAFGLNDFNRGAVEVKLDRKLDKWANRRAKWARSWAKLRDQPPPPVQSTRVERLDYFAMNLREMVDTIKKETGADVILISALQPNPRWKYSKGDMASFAAVTQKVAREKGVAYVDVYNTWQNFAKRKMSEDLLANNANHPNDFGHWIYFQALSALDL